MNLEELLVKARELNGKEEHQAVIDLLTDVVLEEYNNLDLTNEKAEAYYGLGYDYNIDKSYIKAVKAFEKTLELNPNTTKAYNGLGNAYSELNQYEKAIEAYNKAIKIDPDLANPYNGLGNAYSDLNQYEKAIEAYNKAIKIDPDFAYPYNGLGNTYKNIEQHKKAIEAYNKAIKIDPDYAYPYNGLGNTYYNLKQYEKAIEAYNKAIKIDPDFAYPYNGLGNTYKNIEQHKKAIEAYNKAIKIDPDYADSYYNIAQLFYDKGEYDNAISNFEKYIRLKDNPDEYYTKLAKSKLKDIKQLLKNEDLVTVKKTIEDIIDDIKEILSFKEEKVTHYTGISATKAMVLDASLFRLSEGNFLNDTSEGRELFKFLNFEMPTTQNNDTVALPFTEKPFIGSFVPETKHNDLTLWRMYGKEGKDEACGCAITIDRESFLSAIKNSLTGNLDGSASTNLDDQFSFYRVAYISEDTNGNSKFIIPDTGKGVRKLKELMNSLQEKIELFNNVASKNLDDIQYITELLNDIAYLFKSAEYQYEHELRLVVNGTGFKKKVDQAFTPPRVYIELCNINPVITKITLGPKVTLSDEWATSFNYSLDERGYKPEILISHLPYK